MVTDAIADLRMTEVGGIMPIKAVEGLVLALVGLMAVMQPDQWVLASPPVGQLFNLLPNIVHQALGVVLAVSGVTAVGEATGLY